MNIERFRNIIEYSNKNREYMNSKAADFYRCIGMDINNNISNFRQIVRALFWANNYIIIEMPFKDLEIGALSYKGVSLGYTFLNTSLPKVNVNFALCHEIYHIFYQESEFEHKIEFYLNEQYYEHEEEMAANLFVSMVLMPENSFRYMFRKFKNEIKSGDTTITVLAKLMNYFEVPYMAALLRCYELNMLESGEMLKELLETDKESIRKEFARLWLDEDVLKASKNDDFEKLETFICDKGKKYSENGYISDRDYRKALNNIKELYLQIRGE